MAFRGRERRNDTIEQGESTISLVLAQADTTLEPEPETAQLPELAGFHGRDPVLGRAGSLQGRPESSVLLDAFGCGLERLHLVLESSVPDLAGMQRPLQPVHLGRGRFNALQARIGADAGSCNWEADGLDASNLCGTTNAQGRLSNNSTDPCTRNASNPSGLFLHIEQHRYIRDNPGVLIDALQEVLPL